MAFNVNGNPGNPGGKPNLPTAWVVLDTGDHINVVFAYLNNVVHVTRTDAETGATSGTNFDLNVLGTDLPTLVRGSTAYVGFIGADGGVVSWPPGLGNVVLQFSPTLSPPNWRKVDA